MNKDRSAMNSQLPDGYKQTEIGVIPEDWKCVELDQLNPFITSGSRGWADFYSEYGDPFVRITNMFRDSISLDLQDLRYVNLPVDANEGKRTQLYDSDLLISITADIGIISYVDKRLQKPAYINQHIALVRFDKEKVNSQFISYFLSHESSQKWFRGGTDQGAKAGMSLITVRKIKAAVPPLEEQDAIAHALSDIDALIESLDRLLTKKCQIKQGAMQELLRSKDGWEKKYIGDVLTISHGRSQHEVVDENGDYPILASGGEIGRAKKYLYNKPSVLIGRKGTIDKPQYMDQPFWTVDTLFYSVIHEPNDAKYIFYQFCLIPWREYNEASGVPSLNARTIHSIEITLPPPEEQIEIATILSDMNAEIDSIEAKLTKTRQIKQGMMHELLTGRIRLV
jgi:type I restriction enzyme, S subunit